MLKGFVNANWSFRQSVWSSYVCTPRQLKILSRSWVDLNFSKKESVSWSNDSFFAAQKKLYFLIQFFLRYNIIFYHYCEGLRKVLLLLVWNKKILLIVKQCLKDMLKTDAFFSKYPKKFKRNNRMFKIYKKYISCCGAPPFPQLAISSTPTKCSKRGKMS